MLGPGICGMLLPIFREVPPSVVNDELDRLRSLLKNAHEQPRTSGLRRLTDLIANKFAGRKKRAMKSGEKEKTKKTAA